MSEMCAKHAAEHAAWVSPPPSAFRSLGGRGGINIVQIGKPTAARIKAENDAYVERAWAGVRDQCEMIKRFCAENRNCSSRLEDMWTGDGDGIKPEPTVETVELP